MKQRADGQGERLVLRMRHIDERDADFLLDGLELDLHLLAQLQVEGAERLVEEQHLRAHHQRARQRDALLLAAGELGGPGGQTVLQPDLLPHAPDGHAEVCEIAGDEARLARRPPGGGGDHYDQ